MGVMGIRRAPCGMGDSKNLEFPIFIKSKFGAKIRVLMLLQSSIVVKLMGFEHVVMIIST